MKTFNNAGPSKPDMHYTIDPMSRMDWEEIHNYIDQQRYFLMHAPRQTGKTTTLLAMMKRLNEEGRYACAYANIEGAQAARGDVESGVAAICSAIGRSISLYLADQSVQEWLEDHQHAPTKDRLTRLLEYWSTHSSKPTILLLDEVDALIGDTLISLLRQIRAGYAQRPEAFPHAMILCGVRDIKDYRIHTKDHEIITGGSAFNIKAESIRMGNFSFEECKELWSQHTEATGQVFEEAIYPELWEDTKGQPWLVNALGYELTWKNKELRKNPSITITLEHYKAAREALIYSRATHLDQLTDKLREPRVHRVMSALLSNTTERPDFREDDLSYVEDLGLITIKPSVMISNRIYREVIPRELTYATQYGIANQEQSWYINPDRSLNIPKLLEAFQQFFREHADSWIGSFDYKEAGPQLLMQAFLQRIINGGGRIGREYALGRKRTDLFIEWPTSDAGFFGTVQRVVIELKILHKSLEATIAEGIAQTKDYALHVGANEAHLVIFDRSSSDWDAKIWEKEVQGLSVWGC
ncbi:MAG: AAA-like domain-containing protein [Campylobacterales bacterium]|nr:AAA-like domain-containing protein [Campylobacterales bacterium]